MSFNLYSAEKAGSNADKVGCRLRAIDRDASSEPLNDIATNIGKIVIGSLNNEQRDVTKLYIPGAGGNRQTRIDLLTQRDVYRNKYILNGLSIEGLEDALKADVPSLWEQRTVLADTLDIWSPPRSESTYMDIFPDADSKAMLKQEREAIQDVLFELLGDSAPQYVPGKYFPQIRMAEIPTTAPQFTLDEIEYEITPQLPFVVNLDPVFVAPTTEVTRVG